MKYANGSSRHIQRLCVAVVDSSYFGSYVRIESIRFECQKMISWLQNLYYSRRISVYRYKKLIIFTQ